MEKCRRKVQFLVAFWPKKSTIVHVLGIALSLRSDQPFQPRRLMATKTLDITEARNQFNRLDERLRDEKVIVVTRHNKKVFAVVDLEHLSILMETIDIMTAPDTLEMLNEALEDLKNEDLHDHEDVKRDLE